MLCLKQKPKLEVFVAVVVGKKLTCINVKNAVKTLKIMRQFIAEATVNLIANIGMKIVSLMSEIMEIIDAVCYGRKSPDDKEDVETSKRNQFQSFRLIAAEKSWSIQAEFWDNLTGTDRDRPGFLAMLEYIKKHPNVRVIIVKDQSRFARDPSFFIDTLRDLDAYNVLVYSIIKRTFLSHEHLEDTMMSVVDYQYIIKQKHGAAELQRLKKEKGLPVCVAPYGYMNGKVIMPDNTKEKGWIVKQKEAEKVKIVCQDYLLYVPMEKTIEDLKINKPLYYRILKNARNGIYNGFVVYSNRILDSNKYLVRKELVSYPGIHEHILTDIVVQELKIRWDKRHP